MIKIPYEELVLKINEKTKIPISEIEERVDKKLKQLSGLISKEGAAHIIANELGAKIFEPLSGKLQIKNILNGMRDVETVGKVLQVYEIREFFKNDRAGKVASILIGDETGTIRVTMWGSQADNVTKIEPGNVVKIIGAYTRDNQGRIELQLNDRSQLLINPQGEVITEVKSNSTRKEIKSLSENDTGVELMGTIVRIFDIKYFEVCPKCSKRVKQGQDFFTCDEHGNVIPDYSYVLNAVLDDGTETIRCVFFRSQLEKLLAMTQQQILKFKAEPAEFEAVKNEAIGLIVKLSGKTNKNAMFNRLEFVVNQIERNPNPEEELKRLQE